MLKSSLCDYRCAEKPVKGTILVAKTADSDEVANNANRKVIFKSCAIFTDFISEINNTQIDNSKDIHVVIPMYNLIEYSDIYSNALGSLCQYHRDELALNNAGTVIDFLADKNESFSFKFKEKITGQTGAGSTKDVYLRCS